MRIVRLGSLFALGLLLSATCANAQQAAPPAPAPRDAQAVSVLQRSLAAMAGSDNETGSATLKATAIGQGRLNLSLLSGQRSEIEDISQAPPTGSWCGPDSVWHSMAGHNLFSDPTWFFPAFLIGRALSTSNYAISAMDAETQDGIAVEHVQIYQQLSFSGSAASLLQSLSQIDIYLNSSTLMPVSIAFNTHADNNASLNIPIQIKFSSYQAVQGISVPYHIQKYIQNGLALDLTVSSVQVISD